MATKKQKQRNQVIVIGLVLVLIFFMLNQMGSDNLEPLSFASSNEGVNQNPDDGITLEVYSIPLGKNGIKPFIITVEPKKTVFNQGESIEITDTHLNFENCNVAQSDLKIRKAFSFTTVDSSFDTIGPSAFQTIFYKYTISGSKTLSYAPGTYIAESQWLCDGRKQGGDGCSSLGQTNGLCDDTSGTDPNRFEFEIQSQQEPLISEQQCGIVSGCDPGYKLINPDTALCQCSAQFQCGNNECELGESGVLCPVDCGIATSCPEGQIIADGVCVNPGNVCIKAGGTVDCSRPPSDDDDLPIDTMILIGIGLVAGGLFLNFQQRNKNQNFKFRRKNGSVR